jgi:predicted transport protein
MSDINLFRIQAGRAVELPGKASDLEKPLQVLIEQNLEVLLGVRFLASEHSTGKTHAGRIDTLGIDEDNCPVILEYKRSKGENVINQGLFYLDWLMDHKAEFELMVLKRYGAKVADAIDWAGPRLICIASDFTKYDGHAVQQMSHSIELIRYKQFGADLLLLEQVNSVVQPSVSSRMGIALKNGSAGKATTVETSTLVSGAASKQSSGDKTVGQWFGSMSPDLRALFDSLEGYVTSLGDDVQRKDLKLYVAFKRLRNFTCVGFKKDGLFLWLKLDPTAVALEQGFSRDVRQIGHWGTGDVEVMVKNHSDLDRAKALIQKAYEG